MAARKDEICRPFTGHWLADSKQPSAVLLGLEAHMPARPPAYPETHTQTHTLLRIFQDVLINC